MELLLLMGNENQWISSLMTIPEQNCISLVALFGGPSAATLRFIRIIAGQLVQVLLDGNNTNSFMQTQVAHHLRLLI